MDSEQQYDAKEGQEASWQEKNPVPDRGGVDRRQCRVFFQEGPSEVSEQDYYVVVGREPMDSIHLGVLETSTDDDCRIDRQILLISENDGWGGSFEKVSLIAAP